MATDVVRGCQQAGRTQRRIKSPQEARADIVKKESGAHEAQDSRSQQTNRSETSIVLEDSVTERGESTQCTSAPAAVAHAMGDVENGPSQQKKEVPAHFQNAPNPAETPAGLQKAPGGLSRAAMKPESYSQNTLRCI